MLDTEKTYDSKNYGKFKIVEYRSFSDVVIRFLETGFETTVTKNNLLKGLVKDHYLPNIYGVGYNGQGEFNVNFPCKKVRSTWERMFERSYSIAFHNKFPSYKDCKVDKQWHCFQDFAAWSITQKYYRLKNYHLDKDLIVLSNKTYGPDYCSYVPVQINSLLLNGGSAFVKGVEFKTGRYGAYITINSKKRSLGWFSSYSEARDTFLCEKVKYIHKEAEKFKSDIDSRVYVTLSTITVDSLKKLYAIKLRRGLA